MKVNFGVTRRYIVLCLSTLILAVQIVETNFYVRHGKIRCSVSADSKAVDCSHRSLSKPPLNLPAFIEYLDLSNNLLDGNSLLHLGYLKSLRYLKLNGNRIEVISDQKFPRLSSLETLLLAKNPLKIIEGTVFDKLLALKYINIDRHNLHCDSNITLTLRWLLNIQARISLLPSGNSIKCYDRTSAKYEIATSLDAQKFESELKSKTHGRRSKRSGISLVIAQWSCNIKEKIILLYNSTLSTYDQLMCNDYCFEKGYSFTLLDASTCLCGVQKSPKSYRMYGCTYKCHKSSQSSGCNLRRRSYEELSLAVKRKAYLEFSATSDLSDSALSTMTKISKDSPEIVSISTVKTGKSNDAALNVTSLQPSPTIHYNNNQSTSTARAKTTSVSSSSLPMSNSSSSPKSQTTTTPVLQSTAFEERTRYVSPKISAIPITSHTVNYVASTTILSDVQEVVNTDHRSIRERRGIGSPPSSSSNYNAPKLEVISSRGALTFTNESSYKIFFAAVNVTFSRDASAYLLRYFIEENSINLESAGVNITGSNSIAVPVNTMITISLSFAIEKEDGVIVQRRYDGLVSNLSVSAGTSGNNSWQTFNSINSGTEGPFIYEFRLLGNEEKQLATLQLNFTSMEPIQHAPKRLLELKNYTATFEDLHFAFGTNYSFVQATWTLFEYSNSNPVEKYRNNSTCLNSCPASVGNCLLYTCILHMTYYLRNNGNYAVEIAVINPVTSVALKERLSFTAETRITQLSIDACDYSANVNQSKKFNLKYVGTIISVRWFVDGLSIANDTDTINHTATDLKNYTLTVKANNHISERETSVYIRLYQWGSVHGLNITQPAHDSYKPTLKDVSFSSALCDGEQPLFYWDFGDGSNATTTLSSIKHNFTLPNKYTISLKVNNTQEKTEMRSIVLNLQDEIRNFTASSSKTIVAVEESLFVRTHIDKGTSVKYKIHKKDVNVPDFNTNVSTAFHFKQAGSFDLKITASNKVSEGGPVTITVYVQEMIKLSLKEKLYRTLNNVESFSASRLSGTDMHTKWDFGDENGTDFTFTDRAEPTAKHTYQKEGQYTVILFAKNDVQSEVNYTSLFYVERPLKNDVSFTLPQYAATNVSFLANVSVQYPSIYGYNATLADRRYLLSGSFHQINMTLSSAKNFTLTLEVWNHVSSLSQNDLITVQDPINTEVKVTPMVVAVSTIVRLHAVVQGSDPMFSWQFQDLNYSNTGNIISHAFAKLGMAYFNVTASNKVSSFTSQLKIHVQHNISNLSLYSNASFTAPNTTVLILSSLSMRPEHAYAWKINGSVLNQSGDKITYAFPSLGKYWVSLNVTNDISSQTAAIEITVQEPISGTSISLPKNQTFIPFNETVTLYAMSASGNSMTFTWCVESKCVNNSNQAYNIIVLKLSVLYINVTVIIENDISKDSSTELIPVVQRIEDLHIKVTTYRGSGSPYLTIVNKLVAFEIDFSTGNHFSVEWRIAGILVNMNETKLTYNFTQPGDFKVEVLLRNSINSAASKVNVTVESTFDIIDVAPRLVETNKTAVFSTIGLTLHGVRLEWFPPKETGSQALKSVNVSLKFEKAGIYPLSVKGSNLLIQVNKTFYITVQDRVTNLTVMPKTKFYRTMTSAHFNASVISGTNVTFTWKLTTDSISCQNADQPRLSCHLTTWGRYGLSVNASNLINSLYHTLYIYVQDAVQITTLTSKYGTVLPTNEKLMLEAAILGTNVSDASSMQDKDKGHIEYFGNRTSIVLIRSPGMVGINITAWNKISLDSKVFNFTVQERLVNVSIWRANDFVPVGVTVKFQAVPENGTDLLFAWYVNSTKLSSNTEKTLDYWFENEGTYEIKVDVRNGIINSSKSSHVYINAAMPACVPPTIKIHGGKQRTLSRSQWLYFEASIEYNCSTSSVSSSWSLKIAKESTNCMIEGRSLALYSLGPDVDLTATMLAIQPEELKVGTYCLYYIAKYGLSGRFIIFSASMLKVIPTPPVPVILGGVLKMVGQNQSFILDGSNSIDPDNQQPTEILFRWSCTPHKENATSTKLIHTGCRNTSWLPWNDGKQLTLYAGSLVAGYSYNFVLSVKRPGRTPYSTSQKVTVLSLTMPDVYIKCVTCSVYKTSKYISNRSLKLLGICSNCNTDFGRISTLNTNWLVTSSNGTMILNVTKSQTEINDLLTILPGRLDGFSNYTIRFSVEVPGDIISRGYSEILLNPNHGPQNGSCAIEPLIGVTLETRFTFKCNGWMDSDNTNSPLIYWLRFQTSTASWDILYRGIRNSVSVYLPVGDSNQQGELLLQILVEDIHGALTVGLERMVTVNPPKEDPTEFLNTNVVSSINLLTSEKDMNKVVAVTQASVKLLNESGPIGTRQESILSSVTESASQMSAPSLEAVDQLSNALRSSVGLVNENAFQSQTRRTLTTSLEKMINKVDVFALKGQLADQSSLKSLLFLAQNNIASDTLRTTNGRVRRATSQVPSEIMKNLNLVMQLYMAILRTRIRGEDASVLSNKYGKVVLKRDKSVLLNKTLTADNCGFVLKKSLITHSDIFQVFNVSYNDPFTSPSPIESKIAGLSYSTANGTQATVKDLPYNESILITLDGSTSRKKAWSNASSKIIKAKTSVDGEMTAMGLNATSAMLIIEVISNTGSVRSIDAYLKPKVVPANGSAMVWLNASRHGSLIKHFHPGEFNASERYSIKISNNNDKQDANISLLVFSSSCVFWDRNNKTWNSEGVAPTEETNIDFTVCRTSHLTSFASTFKIAPNPIRWSTLSEINVESNPIALALCLTLVGIYIVGIFFSARKDEKDRQESHYIPMMGKDEFYKYEVRIKTGSFPGAGTTANVGIQVYATKGATKQIVVAKKNSFQRNSVDIFRFASATGLGKVSRIRIWHDNSGSGPSWYLSRVVIKNLLDGQKYFFFCNRWLAVDRDDGEIERFFHVADSKMMSRFQTIFNDTIGRTFTDYHLWMSVFEKPKLSRFTRVQRLTCCVTFLLSWMCINAMWYGTVRESVDLYVGFKSYSYEEIIVGIISSLMVFPVNFIIIMVFRNCRLPASRQIFDGDDEIAIHVLSKSHHTRRLSEDSIEIEDATESHVLLNTSLPRCGGYFRLMSFNKRPSFQELPSNNSVENIFDQDSREFDEQSADSFNGVSTVHKASVGLSRMSNVLQSGHLYSKLPISYGTTSDVIDNSERYQPRQGSSRCSTAYDRATISTNITTLSSRNGEQSASVRSEIEIDPEVVPDLKNYNSEYEDKLSALRNQRLSDSFIRKHSNPRANTAIDTHHNKISDDTVDDKELTRDLPDIFELDPSLDWLLPSWFIVIAYLACFTISVLSILVILIYGQQFGRDKALSWLQSIFSGLIQDVFVTYPILLILVAFFLALVRKPMNLDYSDFVSCPVIPGDPSVSSEPVRGYALELAQKQGRGKREIRRILKNLGFQLVHLWLVLSICLTSYESHISNVKKQSEVKLFPGKQGIQEIDSINKLWQWMETDLPNFLYPATANSEYWILRSEPRLRQVRIRTEKCIDLDTAKAVNNISVCNPEFSNADIEKGEFLMNWTIPGISQGTPWSFKTEEELNGTAYLGRLGIYPHSGYSTTLFTTKSQFLSRVISLKAAGWLDLRTRALFIGFVLQNVNINRYAVYTVAFEFSSTGFVLQQLEVIYLRVHMYITRLDNFRLFCEVMFGLLTFYQLWRIQDKLRRRGRRFFDKFWNIHLLLGFMINICTVGLSIYRLIIFLELRPFLKTGVPQGYDLRKEAIIDWSIQACFGAVCFILIIKIISLLSWVRSYRVIACAFRRSFKQLLVLVFGFVICLIAFASWGNLAFGSSYYRFQTFWRAVLYTVLFRIWDKNESNIPEDGVLIVWKVFLTIIFLVFVLSFFRSALCASYKVARRLYRTGQKRNHGDIAKYLQNRLTLRKKKTAKRVKFSLNPSIPRNTLATSQQTISLGSDQWLSSHSLSSYTQIPSYVSLRTMSQLAPITDEILHYVNQLELDDIMEDEFYSKLESIANDTQRSKMQPTHALGYRYVVHDE